MVKPYLTGLAALMGLSVLAVAARAGEEKIAVEKLPAAVKKAVKKKFPEAKIQRPPRRSRTGRRRTRSSSRSRTARSTSP